VTEAELEAVKSHYVVDGRRDCCPGAPTWAAKRTMIGVKAGQVMEVLSADAVTNKGLPAWARKVGHEFLGTLEGPGYSRLFIRRTE